MLRPFGGVNENAGALTASSSAALLTSHASSANTKGSYTQLIASTARATEGMILQIRGFNTERFLIDIAIGAAASEIVVVPNLACAVVSNSCNLAYIPLAIASGVRVAARVQSNALSNQIQLQLFLIHGLPGLHRATTYGADTANSRGTLATASASLNTKGNYAELTASTTNPIKILYVCSSPGTTTAGSVLCDIAVGAAGSERVIISNLYIRHATANRTNDIGGAVGPFPVDIPAGTRLSACIQSNVASVESGVSILGLD